MTSKHQLLERDTSKWQNIFSFSTRKRSITWHEFDGDGMTVSGGRKGSTAVRRGEEGGEGQVTLGQVVSCSQGSQHQYDTPDSAIRPLPSLSLPAPRVRYAGLMRVKKGGGKGRREREGERKINR